jgi:hypothetical protein
MESLGCRDSESSSAWRRISQLELKNEELDFSITWPQELQRGIGDARGELMKRKPINGYGQVNPVRISSQLTVSG